MTKRQKQKQKQRRRRRLYAPTRARQLRFAQRFECKNCNLRYEEPEPRLFSFNNPYGACPRCQASAGSRWSAAARATRPSSRSAGASCWPRPTWWWTDRLAPRSVLDEPAAGRRGRRRVQDSLWPSVAQEHINAALISHAQACRFVVRLKGGDPYVFGRGAEEVLACLQALVPVTVVPA